MSYFDHKVAEFPRQMTLSSSWCVTNGRSWHPRGIKSYLYQYMPGHLNLQRKWSQIKMMLTAYCFHLCLFAISHSLNANRYRPVTMKSCIGGEKVPGGVEVIILWLITAHGPSWPCTYHWIVQCLQLHEPNTSCRLWHLADMDSDI